jgi:hypothetical protein
MERRFPPSGTTTFASKPVHTPYHFEIAQDRRGYWIARDVGGLIGGVFRTKKDAIRFALLEVNGDSAHVHVLPEPAAELWPSEQRGDRG